MNRQVQKLKYYQNRYIGKTKQQMIFEWETSLMTYGDRILHYSKSYKLVFRDDILFFMEDDIVTDIVITEYFLGLGIRNIFYFKNENPEYKVAKLFDW